MKEPETAMKNNEKDAEYEQGGIEYAVMRF